MWNKEATSDFAEGYRAGFEEARTQITAAVEKALAEYRSVRKAMRAVQLPVEQETHDEQACK
jgi:hypothetical protein